MTDARIGRTCPLRHRLRIAASPGTSARWSTLAQQDGWEVCVVATRTAASSSTSRAGRGRPDTRCGTTTRTPATPTCCPPADAMIVAPATVNTINKWAAGIADTLALGLLVEGLGLGLPIVAVPFTNAAMAAHPAFGESLARLRELGRHGALRRRTCCRPAPAGHRRAAPRTQFPWHLRRCERARRIRRLAAVAGRGRLPRSAVAP